MDERLMKSLIKALGINPDEMVEGAKKFVIEIQAKQKAIEDSLVEIQAKQNLILSLLSERDKDCGSLLVTND